jgi:Fe-S-cluster containining protein
MSKAVSWPARILPCNGCTECCKREALFLYPEHGDDVSQYKTRVIWGRRALRAKANGDCIYLGPKGCTIWRQRPIICREFDCVDFVRSDVGIRMASPEMIRAARACAKRMKEKQA